jgi:hypothetical protein
MRCCLPLMRSRLLGWPQSQGARFPVDGSLIPLRLWIATVTAVALSVTLVGCGSSGSSGTDRAQVDAELALVKLEFASNVAAAAKDGSGDLETATDDLIAFVRSHRDALGKKDAARELADAASQVQPWCQLCADRLDRARDTL